MLRWICSIALLGATFGCAAPAPAPPAKIRKNVAEKKAPAPTQPGAEEQIRKKRQIKIWGEVRVIIAKKHMQLPEMTAKVTGSDEDPVATIKNQTSASMTLWFAGRCAHKVIVPAGKLVTASFCAGTYHVAAKIDDKAFLPLVRENQLFKNGVNYTLDFFVRRAPKVKTKRRYYYEKVPAKK